MPCDFLHFLCKFAETPEQISYVYSTNSLDVICVFSTVQCGIKKFVERPHAQDSTRAARCFRLDFEFFGS